MSRRFKWGKLPIGMQIELARACGLNDSDSAESLRKRFKEPPKIWMVEEFWAPTEDRRGLRDGWLAADDASRRAIVRQLRDRGLGDSDRQTRSTNGELRYLRTCRNSTSLREVVLKRIIDSGRDGSDSGEGEDGENLAVRYRRFWKIDSNKAPAVNRPPYPHQIAAWKALDDHGRPLAGIIALPTGAGKTRTATQWILENVLSDPNPRVVLWIAHRAELLQQAAESFIENANFAKRKHPLRIRVISGAHRSRVTTLGSPADVVLVTVQSLARRKDLVKAFFKDHPEAFVVIDEAHHAAAKSYRDIVASMRANGKRCDLLGLTATPTRTHEDEIGVLFGVFPQRILHETSRRKLIRSKILSRPIVETVQTHEDFEADFTAEEWNFVRRFDELSPRSLKRIAASTSRNQLIVKHYKDYAPTYGQTLVFAANIAHCYTLADTFKKAGVKADYVASRRHDDGDEKRILDRYRTGDLDVLVSVGKLTEGFDAPATQSVFLARPTGSLILMKQMIGRGMRGVRAGGHETVRLVSFRDHWQRFPRLWEPEEVFDGEVTRTTDTPSNLRETHAVPEPWNLYDKLAAVSSAHVGLSPSGAAVGWYDLRIGDSVGIVDTAMLVWEHQRPGFDAMIGAADNLNINDVAAYFDDIPDPLPTASELKTFATYLSEVGTPMFVEFTDRSQYAPADVARRLKDTGFSALPDAIRSIYDSYPAPRSEYPSFQDYLAAVMDAANRRFSTHRDFSEDLPQVLDPAAKLPPGNPDLDRLLAETMAEYGDLLATAPEAHRLESVPPVRWGKQRARSQWAFHRSHDRPSGCAIIVNPILRTSAIQEQTLRFLLFHELIHHVLGNKLGHRGSFRTYERQFDGYQQADADLDSLVDRYKLEYSRRDQRRTR